MKDQNVFDGRLQDRKWSPSCEAGRFFGYSDDDRSKLVCFLVCAKDNMITQSFILSEN